MIFFIEFLVVHSVEFLPVELIHFQCEFSSALGTSVDRMVNRFDGVMYWVMRLFMVQRTDMVMAELV